MYGPGVAAFIARNAALLELHQLTELREVRADQREVVLVVQLPDPADPFSAVRRVDPAAQRVAGVGRVGDQRVLPQQLGDLRDRPGLRVHAGGRRSTGPSPEPRGRSVEVLRGELAGLDQHQPVAGVVAHHGLDAVRAGPPAPAGT